MFLRYRLRALALALGAFVLVPAAAASAAPSTQSFGFGNATQTFTVPADVHEVHLTAWGGSGGAGGARNGGFYAAPAGLGAKIDLDVPVSPGDALRIDVGGRGGAGNDQIAGDGAGAGGSAGRGAPGGTVNSRTLDGAAGGGGGGATTVSTLAGTPLLIAGGGGGAGGSGVSVAGNNGGQGGDAGTAVSGACDPGNGAGAYGNGAGGGAGGRCAAESGPAGVGGAGEAPANGAGTGGGGGGGLIGGSGGSAGGTGGGGGGGGGGGTSYWSAATKNAVVTNGGPGFGGVVVAWDAAPPAGVRHVRSFAGPDRFTVPRGVTELTITGWGASGGAGGGNADGKIASRGGYGAAIRERVTVNPGENLAIEPGGAGGNGGYSVGQGAPIPGGGAGSGAAGPGGAGGTQNGNNGGGPFGVPNYLGGTGGGGGGATQVTNTSAGIVLLTAGGGGGGGGDSAVPNAGINGGPGGNAGSPLVTGVAADGDGFFGSGGSTPGTANGAPGRFAASSSSSGARADDSTTGNARGTGGGGGGGTRGGGAGQQCTGSSCAFSAGGGAAGNSGWAGAARGVNLGNSLTGSGGVRIEWTEPAATSIALQTSAQTLVAGAPLTLTATLSGTDAPAGMTPTGSVFFIDEDAGRSLGGPRDLNDGRATVTTTLAEGTHHIYVSYQGDRVFGAATSPDTIETAIRQLTVSTQSLPPVEVGEPYAATLTADAGTGPYTWSLSSGEIPDGLSLNTATGEITGTPTTAGETAFTVRASDTGDPRQTADAPLTLTVKPATLAISRVTPDELTRGGATVTLIGTRLRPGLELTASDRRIAFSDVTVKDATALTARVSVSDQVPAGAYDVTVREGAASATCSGCLRIKPTQGETVTPSPTPLQTTPTPPSGPAAPAAPPAVTSVATAPRLVLLRAPKAIMHHRVRFTVRCTGAACRGEATARVAGKTAASARFTLAAGKTRTIRLRLKGRPGPVTVTITQLQPDRTITKKRLVVRR